MSLSLVLRAAQRCIVTNLMPTLRFLGGSQLSVRQNFHTVSDNCVIVNSSLLSVSPLPLICATRGMKTKGVLQLRCKDCYYVYRMNRKYVMCKTFGRHKQQQMAKKEENTWRLTAASQGKIRPW